MAEAMGDGAAKEAEALRAQAAADIALARALAEEGRRAPLLGGAVYVVWGVAVAAALLFNWAVAAGLLDITPWAIPAGWFGAMGLAAFVTVRMRSGYAGRPGAVGVGNAVSNAVWRAAGLFLGVYASVLFASLLLSPLDAEATAGDRGVAIARAFAWFTPMTFGVYAIAMEASAAAAAAPWLRSYSRLSFLIMAALIVFAGSSAQFLIAATGAALVLILPGLVMMRRAGPASDG